MSRTFSTNWAILRELKVLHPVRLQAESTPNPHDGIRAGRVPVDARAPGGHPGRLVGKLKFSDQLTTLRHETFVPRSGTMPAASYRRPFKCRSRHVSMLSFGGFGVAQ